MPTVLLVANQTLAAGVVESFVRSRLDSGPPAEFTLLVPATVQGHGFLEQTTRGVTGDIGRRAADGLSGHTSTARTSSAAIDAGYEQARARLEFGLDRLRRLGAAVDGDVGVADVFKAISELLARRRFDEVVLFTLPRGVSRWLHLDIPHHVERKFHVPVTVVTAGQ